MKKTPWFSVKTPPVHEGPYECMFDGSRVVNKRFFKTGKWFTENGKGLTISTFGKYSGDRWRGLTEQAKDRK